MLSSCHSQVHEKVVVFERQKCCYTHSVPEIIYMYACYKLMFVRVGGIVVRIFYLLTNTMEKLFNLCLRKNVVRLFLLINARKNYHFYIREKICCTHSHHNLRTARKIILFYLRLICCTHSLHSLTNGRKLYYSKVKSRIFVVRILFTTSETHKKNIIHTQGKKYCTLQFTTSQIHEKIILFQRKRRICYTHFLHNLTKHEKTYDFYLRIFCCTHSHQNLRNIWQIIWFQT